MTKADKSGHVLSNMERYILQMMADNPDENMHGIAKLTSRSYTTVQTHSLNIFKKLGVHSKLSAVLEGWYLGEITLLNKEFEG